MQADYLTNFHPIDPNLNESFIQKPKFHLFPLAMCCFVIASIADAE